ncbi:ion channel [Legionella maioricensis]|uniref:ion channel n=1 Tax=Legionella maioricensis TaxID=2896528 RepID=UPI003D6D434D
MYSRYPQSILGFESYPQTRAIYCSFRRLTTVGFGDVIATSSSMQCLAWIEAFCGQAYLAVFIYQLVRRYLAGYK